MNTGRNPDLPPPLPDAGRVDWVDLYRGLAILLVVAGHVARGLGKPGIWHFEGSGLDRWLYAFHMPAFFFASGLFLGRSMEKGPGRFLSDKLRAVLYPYVLWSLIHLGLLSVVEGGSGGRPWLRILYDPPGNYWFLYVLFIVQMFYLVTAAVGGRRAFWLLCLLAWAVEPAKPLDGLSTHLWAWHNVMKYGVYVALGDYVAWRRYEAYARPADCRLYALIFFALMTFMVALGASKDTPWLDLPLAIAGIQGLWELSIGLDNRRNMDWLRFLGRRSLEIYVAHGVALAAMRQTLLTLGVTGPWTHFALGMLAGILVPLALWRTCDRLKFPYLFRFGKAAPTATSIVRGGWGGRKSTASRLT